eukprot:c18286_g1_i1 orf=1072-3648(-)
MLSTAAQDESSSVVCSPTTPSPPPPPPTTSAATASASVAVDDKRASAGKKATRQWEAWTHEEEESFFIALRNVGKNFDKITSKVQSKNKDQVRHYYYRVIRRINKLLGPGFSLDAKNTKDANSAMLRWWSLLEKQSCSASKLHLKPRRFKTFVTALEHQLLKDRVKANKKRKPPRAVSVVVTPVARKPTACGHEAAKAIAVENSCSSKLVAGKNSSIRLRNDKRQEPSQVSRKRKKGSDCGLSAAAIKRWEKAATAGVSLVAEAAEQVERAAAEQLGQVEPSLKESKLCTRSSGEAHPETSLLSGRETMQILADTVEGTMEEGKLKLQLYPIDEATRKSMEQDGVHPFLQLTLKPRKSVSSVVRHLVQKWGRSSAATGELLLFPFSTQVESMGTCQSWSLHDANVNAGDVHCALGNPTVFRLRYGWFPSGILQSPQAKCLHLSVVRAEAGLQASSAMTMAVQPSTHALPLARFPCFVSSDKASDSPEALNKEFLCCAGNAVKRDSVIRVQGCEAIASEPFVESVKSRCSELSCLAWMAVSEDNQADVLPKSFELVENAPMSRLKSVDGRIQVDARNAINTFGQGSTDCRSDGGKGLPENTGHKVEENGGNLAAYSWLNEGSNDSFVQRIWAIEDSPNAGPLLPSEIDWADTLTNISLGEFLSEVSQTGHLTSGVASSQALQPMQSLDSFDAAVAAQCTDASAIESSLVQHSETPAWDSEETRDAFAFRKLVSQRQTSAPVQCSLEPSRSAETLRESDGMAASFVDCGSLEAWKQSFSHAELSFPEELKCDPSSQFLPQRLEYLGKGGSSQDLWLQANTQALGSSKDEPFWFRNKALNGTFEAIGNTVRSSAHSGDGSS